MRNHILILTLLLMNFNISYSQLNEQWAARYNGSDDFNDSPHSMAVDDSGNVYVTGVGFFKNGFEDIVTLKYNSSGVQQWMRRYNSSDSSNDIANTIIVDASGNIIVSGESMRRLTGRDIIILKYDPAGALLWSVTYDHNGTVTGKNDDISIVLRCDEDNNIYAGGTSQSTSGGNDYIVLKYDSNGNLIFEKRYSGPGYRSDIIHDLKLDASGNIYVTGESGFSTGGSSDYLTIKYGPAGNTIWTARYDGPISFGDIARAVCIDEAGNVFVTGTSQGENLEDVLTIKYSSSGAELWQLRYNGVQSLNDLGNSMEIDRSGNVYVAAGSVGETFFPEFTAIKYNTEGYQEWVRNYIPATGGSGEATRVKVDRFNNIYFAGNINRAESQISVDDIALISFDTAGNRRSVNLYNGTASQVDLVSDILADNSGNLYVTGKSNGAFLNFDYVTLKYSLLSKIIPVSELIPESFQLEQNYPNPFNPKTVICYSLSEGRFTSLKVYDVLGKEVADLVNENLKAGSYKTEFDASDLPGGVYFYRLTSGESEAVKKMLVIK